MKIAITATGEDLASPLDPRFGRARLLLLLDEATGGLSPLDNRDAADAPQGAGIRAAERVIASGARALLTGHCGPNAFRALAAAGVEVYTTAAATVGGALSDFRAGRLSRAAGPDVDGHGA